MPPMPHILVVHTLILLVLFSVRFVTVLGPYRRAFRTIGALYFWSPKQALVRVMKHMS